MFQHSNKGSSDWPSDHLTYLQVNKLTFRSQVVLRRRLLGLKDSPSDHRLCWGGDCWAWGHDEGRWPNGCTSSHAGSGTGSSTRGHYWAAGSSVVCTYLFPSNTGRCNLSGLRNFVDLRFLSFIVFFWYMYKKFQ